MENLQKKIFNASTFSKNLLTYFQLNQIIFQISNEIKDYFMTSFESQSL